MKISVITITYNSEKTQEETILSIAAQDYLDFEYLIIDGGSTATTVKIIKKYARYIRLSAFSDSFALPEDEYHIPIHSLYNDENVWEKIARFAESSLPVSLFVMAGHSYELEVLQEW